MVSRAFNKLPFSEEMLSMSVPQIDWIVQKLAQENPDAIQITKNAAPVDTDLHTKILRHVDAWNVTRGKAKSDFIKEKIPPKLAEALKKRKEQQSRISPLGKSFAPPPQMPPKPKRAAQ